MPSSHLCRALLAVACAGLAASCPGGAAPERPNLLVIAVDTLRTDRLGCQGNPRGLTPAIDALAASGVHFLRCSSHAPWTLPSFASLFTSLYPPEHGAGGSLGGAFTALGEGARTLAEIARDSGYATAAITNVDFLGERFGVVQGFEHVDAIFGETNSAARRADRTTDAALEWIAGARAPFFLLVHYFDPHALYEPPQPFRERFAEPQDRTGEWTFGTREDFLRHRNGELALDPALLARAAALYDGEVAFTDAEIGRLLAGLRSLGLERSTLVVLTSDHGEEFLDHGSWEHGHSLYEELVHVPLILARPGTLPSVVVADPVRHIDVVPTLCELLDLPLAPSFQGTSLAPAWTAQGRPPANTFAQGNFIGPEKQSWRVGDEKLIGTAGAALELYDLSADPREARDLAALEPARVEVLTRDLTLASKAWRRRAGEVVELTAEEEARLERLGYVDGRR